MRITSVDFVVVIIGDEGIGHCCGGGGSSGRILFTITNGLVLVGAQVLPADGTIMVLLDPACEAARVENVVAALDSTAYSTGLNSRQAYDAAKG